MRRLTGRIDIFASIEIVSVERRFEPFKRPPLIFFLQFVNALSFTRPRSLRLKNPSSSSLTDLERGALPCARPIDFQAPPPYQFDERGPPRRSDDLIVIA